MNDQEPRRTIQELFDLSGRAAIVTGGAGLLGRQMSEALVEAGAAVVIASRTLEQCQAWANELRRRGGRALAVRVDVSQSESNEQLVQATLDQFGRLDILVNNAMARGEPAPAEALTVEAWRTWVDVGLSGAFYCAQAAARPMLVQGGGVIVNIGSIYGLVGVDERMYPPSVPVTASPAYGAIKGGLLTLTRHLAVTWARRGIRVNCLSPGGFPSETIDPEFGRNFAAKVPMGRMGNSTDLKGAIVYLASDASAYMTGQNLLVDGGWTAW